MGQKAKNLKDSGKQKAVSALMRKQMQKQGVPEAQQEQMLSMMNENPELFEKIAKETNALVKQGKSQTSAAMQVAHKYRSEIATLQQRMMKR